MEMILGASLAIVFNAVPSVIVGRGTCFLEDGFEFFVFEPVFEEDVHGGREVLKCACRLRVIRDRYSTVTSELIGVRLSDIGAGFVADDEEEKGIVTPFLSPAEEGTNDCSEDCVDCLRFK